MSTNYAEVLKTHAKQHKLTPGQQANLLIYYLGLRELFPEIPFATYLERTLRVAGATKENLQFPKDALDQHCPTKDSQWPPADRVSVMLTYLALCDILAEGNEPPMPFNVFVAEEARQFKLAEAAAPAATATAVAPATPPVTAPADPTTVPAGTETVAAPAPAPVAAKPKTRAKKVAPAAPVLALTVGARVIYRGPLGDGIGPEQPGVLTSVTPLQFQADSGELIDVADAALLSACPVPELPPLRGDIQHQVSPAELDQASRYLSLAVPVGSVAIGATLLSFAHPIPGVGTAYVQLVNGQPKPYVDAYIMAPDGGTLLVELPPREGSVLGVYAFEVAGTTYSLELACRQ